MQCFMCLLSQHTCGGVRVLIRPIRISKVLFGILRALGSHDRDLRNWATSGKLPIFAQKLPHFDRSDQCAWCLHILVKCDRIWFFNYMPLRPWPYRWKYMFALKTWYFRTFCIWKWTFWLLNYLKNFFGPRQAPKGDKRPFGFLTQKQSNFPKKSKA